MKTIRISIPARWTTETTPCGWTEKNAKAVFTLGLGPCGKTVDYLRLTQTAVGVEVFQRHTDRTSKTFIYRWEDITGRIEVEEELDG